MWCVPDSPSSPGKPRIPSKNAEKRKKRRKKKEFITVQHHPVFFNPEVTIFGHGGGGLTSM